MSIIDGHTCIGDDGGNPNRRCDACEKERGGPAAYAPPKVSLSEWFDSYEFFELMQTYRHANPLKPVEVTAAFNAVIAAIEARVKQ